MLALLDPSKMENAVKVITQMDEKTTGISLKVSLSPKDCLPFRFIWQTQVLSLPINAGTLNLLRGLDLH